MKKLIAIVFLSSLIPHCTVFKKSIKRPVAIYLNRQPVIPHLSNWGVAVKYLYNSSADDYARGFMDNFLQEGAATVNVTLVDDPQKADFTLEIVSFDITERSSSQTISDSKSAYNGQSVVLNTIEVSASCKLTDNKHPQRKLMGCTNSKSRSEKLKNNRDAGDLIFGTNKDRSQYRTKLLRDDICLDLAKDVGRRVWVPITRRIARNL